MEYHQECFTVPKNVDWVSVCHQRLDAESFTTMKPVIDERLLLTRNADVNSQQTDHIRWLSANLRVSPEIGVTKTEFAERLSLLQLATEEDIKKVDLSVTSALQETLRQIPAPLLPKPPFAVPDDFRQSEFYKILF